jgi:Ca2+-binding RTX toxin-like protein
MGNAGDDTLVGGAGNDYLIAGTGNNILEGGKGADKLDGTGGWGVADYHHATTAVTVHLDGSGNAGDEAAGDSYVNVNGVIGSNHADTLVGNNADNWMIGGLGHDTISGSAGSDTLYGSEGDDQLIGGTGNDYLIGGSGNNVLEGGAGADTLDGSDGWGVADYRNATTAVTVRLDNSGNAGDQAAGDHYVNVNGAFGSAFGDTLVGNAGANWIIACGGNDLVQGAGGSDTLYGSEGDDSLDGGAGDDVLFGGAGRDVLTGGSGRDVFVFDTSPSGTMDRIADFSVAEDRIQLDRSVFGGFGASVKLTTGSMASSGGAEVLYNSATGDLSYDADGLGGGAAVKFAVLAPGLALSASHFFLV